MPVFYFDIVDDRLREDLDGRTLAHSACIEPELRRRLADIILKGENPLLALVNVRDERRDIIATATLTAAIQIAKTRAS